MASVAMVHFLLMPSSSFLGSNYHHNAAIYIGSVSYVAASSDHKFIAAQPPSAKKGEASGVIFRSTLGGTGQLFLVPMDGPLVVRTTVRIVVSSSWRLELS